LASPSGTWISVEDELRRACSVTAAPGTLGASLTLLSHTAAAAAANTHAPAASPSKVSSTPRRSGEARKRSHPLPPQKISED
jgi:hypothetical protein